MLRAAIFSDVHGNLHALEAVLADAARAGVDEFWVVGDLVAHGPHPAETIGRLMDLPTARCVRGNTDRYVLTGDVSGIIPPIDSPCTSAEVNVLVNTTASFAWTRGAVTAVGAYDWLASLPVEVRMTLPDGTRALLVHAAPGLDDGSGIQEAMTDQELIDLGVDRCGAELIFVGHTHRPLDRRIGDVRVVNLGSVSVPATAERRAMWTLLTADRAGYRLERRFVEYDMDAVIRDLDEVHHPSAAWLKTKLTDRRAD